MVCTSTFLFRTKRLRTSLGVLRSFGVEDLWISTILNRHEAGDEHILEDWRKLTTSDHLYYMCTKYWADGDVHKYFSPYDSPYDAYITFMNVLDALKRRAQS